MTADAARVIAQSDPFPNVNAQWGQAVAEANRKVRSLITTLRELDGLTAILEEHGITVSVDLGPIGNAATAARRDLEKQRDTPTFQMPTAGEPLPTKADPHLTHPQKRI
jgi:hypothetical protein